MAKRFLLACLLLVSAVVFAKQATPLPLTYNGETLPLCSDFKRKTCGWVKSDACLPEISGIACSRVTPGYIWMQSDDYEDCIVATTELGQKRTMLVNFSKKIRWDWEDMSGGVYEGKNYLFIGAFGDNEETDGNYYIVYLEEPTIVNSAEIKVTPSSIRFEYPDGKKHNAEALMYDNVEQVIYVITKVYYNVCQVFSLPFRLDYGSTTQTLTYVCDLGVISDIEYGEYNGQLLRCKGFHLVTAADISPDGKYVLIKNHNNIGGYASYSWILYWERQGDESIAETVKRQPQVIDCYEYEWQGEAICWLDDNTFYTTSDSDGEPPIYKYTRRGTPVENIPADRAKDKQLILIDNTLYISSQHGLYSIDGRLMR